MRALLLVILGLAIGAIGATFALSALRQGTPFHKGVMAVMDHHLAALRADMRANTCEAKAVGTHLVRLREASGDVRDAFGTGLDADFGHAADHLAEALDKAVAAAPGTCGALSSVLRPVGEACDACHRRYR